MSDEATQVTPVNDDPSTEPGTGPSTEPRTGPATELRTGNAGKGRPKGSLNKVTLAAREAILLAAEGLGGVERLVAWANKNDDNERLFWTVIYPKVLPLGGGPDMSAAAAVTGALVWRMPDCAAAAAAPPGAATAAEEAEDAMEAAATDPVRAAEAAEAAADPAPVGATVVWKAPGSAGMRVLPGLPGGPAVAAEGDAATEGGAPAKPPPAG